MVSEEARRQDIYRWSCGQALTVAWYRQLRCSEGAVQAQPAAQVVRWDGADNALPERDIGVEGATEKERMRATNHARRRVADCMLAAIDVRQSVRSCSWEARHCALTWALLDDVA